MNKKRQVSKYWQLKAAVCSVFFAFWAAKCHAQLGTPPIIAVQPLGGSVPKGGTISISSTAISLTPMNFVWNINGHPVADPKVSNVVVPLVGTISTLTIKNASAADNGNFSLTISNAVGSVTSINAPVTVLGIVAPLTLSIASADRAIGCGLQLSGPQGSNYVIEASTDLVNWVPISTNAAPSGSVSYMDTDATNHPVRFYRGRLQ